VYSAIKSVDTEALDYCIIVSTVGWTGCDWSLILRTLSSFSALTLLIRSFDP